MCVRGHSGTRIARKMNGFQQIPMTGKWYRPGVPSVIVPTTGGGLGFWTRGLPFRGVLHRLAETAAGLRDRGIQEALLAAMRLKKDP